MVAYYSGQLDLQAALKHPEWVGRNADGSIDHWARPWLGCCHHSPFREYLMGMYREIISASISMGFSLTARLCRVGQRNQSATVPGARSVTRERRVSPYWKKLKLSGPIASGWIGTKKAPKNSWMKSIKLYAQ